MVRAADMTRMDTVMAASPEALPARAGALLDTAPFQSSRAWWRCVTTAALPPGARPCFLLCGDAARAVALFAFVVHADGRAGALTTPYTTAWAPLLAADASDVAIAEAGAACGRACRVWPTLRWDCLDADGPGLVPLLRGLRRAGLRAARFDHFGAWSEPTAGMRWRDYLRARPGVLRETARRKLARAERDARLRFSLARDAAGLADYQDVYRRSWKPPEPYPAFDATLLEAAARAGVLRMGLLYRDEVPVAAQYWVVADGVATVLKLAHDEAVRALSPGTALTAWMIRRLLDEERVSALDFGRGDDPYKQLWASRRRQRIGLVLADPFRPAGAVALTRQWLGDTRRRLAGKQTHAHPV